ncbi:primosomal protein N' [Candidatus Saccharibacteria bacterium]|nr:primosomal protein N' [Candidatus Saccharibacteria bacterium]
MFYEVIPEGKVEAFIYDYDDSLLPGQVVTVPVGRRVLPGVVVKKVAQPEFKTKSILKVLYSKPLPRHLLETVKFVNDYYLTSSGAALSLVLPRGVEKKRRKTEQMFGILGEHGSDGAAATKHVSEADIPLNAAQKNALKALQKAAGATKLLYGVTGSGKTNVYLKMANNALLEQKSTVLLVPEIALTGQLVKVFQNTFGNRVVLMHSGQTEAERHLIFEAILESEEPLIVVGPRSALFAPLNNLGLIIIDEEHDGAYHQDNAPRYSAIRVASFMAKAAGCQLILGSATPMVEDFYLASTRDSVIRLTEKAKTEAVKPKIEVIDFTNRDNFTKNKYLSNSLLAAIAQNLEHKRQTLIFHNRRGSSPLTICENCGEELLCPKCYLPLTLHADTYELVCHTCEHREKVPTSCPNCGSPGLIHKGFGTKLIESELKKLFPEARIRRFDADNKKGEGMDAIYPEVKRGEVDILVGTQTIVKGLDLPKLSTVGVVQADAGLNLPDYMAEERSFQLLTQVIGRVGRGHIDKAEVFIQTFRPDHPVIKFATDEDYLGFYEYTVERRQKSGFPPFRFVMKLEIALKTEALAIKKIQGLAAQLKRDKRFIVSPPQPSFHERTSKGYSWQIVVRSRSRKALIEVCDGLDKNFKITLDPPGLL